MARKVNTKELNTPTPVIIGAGITEQWYFSHLKNLFDFRVKIKPRFFGPEDIFHFGKRIEQVLEQNSMAICVFDVDTIRNNPAEKAKFEELKRKYSNREDVMLCDSLPSIEYWFLIHYEDTNRYFGNSKDVIKAMEPYIPNYEKKGEFLQNQKWVSEMDNEGENRKKAIDRAKKYPEGKGSYTNVYKAIEYVMETK